MSSFRGLITGAVLSIFGMGSAQAALITETWQSTITEVNHTVFNVGDTFNWTVTYDDTSLRMHQYSDGVNGIAEYGAGDDTVEATLCARSEAGTCTYNYPSDHYSLMADAVFDISEFYNPLANAGLAGYNLIDSNRSTRWSLSSGANHVLLYADDFQFRHFEGNTYYLPQGNATYSYTRTLYTSEIISTETVGVPEPTSLALMGLGLAGLGFARRKQA